MQISFGTQYAFVAFLAILTGVGSAESREGRVEFPNKIIPNLYNGQVTSLDGRWSKECANIFVESQGSSWILSPSKNLENEKVERIKICVDSTKRDGAFDVLIAGATSESNCGKWENKNKAAREEGYFNCNSQFRETGLLSNSKIISKEKFISALESPAILAEGKNIFNDVFLKHFNSAMKEDKNDIEPLLDLKTLLVRFWPYLTQSNMQELLVAFGKKTALKEFPPELVTHADEYVIQTAKKQVREFWETAYKKQMEALLSPAADLKKVELRIKELSAGNNTLWSQEDFDSALPKLQKAAATIKAKNEKRDQQAAIEEQEQQREIERKIIQFRKSIQIGSWTNCGQVYFVGNKPMIGVQTMLGQQFIDINRLFPQGFGCHFKNGVYVGTSAG